MWLIISNHKNSDILVKEMDVCIDKSYEKRINILRGDLPYDESQGKQIGTQFSLFLNWA